MPSPENQNPLGNPPEGPPEPLVIPGKQEGPQGPLVDQEGQPLGSREAQQEDPMEQAQQRAEAAAELLNLEPEFPDPLANPEEAHEDIDNRKSWRQKLSGARKQLGKLFKIGGKQPEELLPPQPLEDDATWLGQWGENLGQQTLENPSSQLSEEDLKDIKTELEELQTTRTVGEQKPEETTVEQPNVETNGAVPEITQERLEKTQQTSEKAAEKINYVELETGEVVTAEQAKKLEEKREMEKEAATEILQERLQSKAPGAGSGELHAIAEVGEEGWKKQINERVEQKQQAKEKEMLIKDGLGPKFIEDLKRAHPALLNDKELDILKQARETPGMSGLKGAGVGGLIIEKFMKQVRQMETAEEATAEPEAVPPSGGEGEQSTEEEGVQPTEKEEVPTAETPQFPPEDGEVPIIETPQPPPEDGEGGPQAPEEVPEAERPLEDFEKDLTTKTPGRNLEKSYDRHRKVIEMAKNLVEDGESAQKKLKLDKEDIEIFLLPLLSQVSESYSRGQYHAVARTLEGGVRRDEDKLIEAFGKDLELRVRNKDLSNEFISRVEKDIGIQPHSIEEFYNKVTKNGKLQTKELGKIFAGLIGGEINKRENRVVTHIQEIRRQQGELRAGYLEARKNREVLQIEKAVFQGAASQDELDAITRNARMALAVENGLKKALPEDPQEVTQQPRSKLKTAWRALVAKTKRKFK